MGSITENVKQILAEIPPGLRCSRRQDQNAREILEVLAAGIRIIGENYVQEAEALTRRCPPPRE